MTLSQRKAEHIRRLQRYVETEIGGVKTRKAVKVAMCGDGINDAPVMH